MATDWKKRLDEEVEVLRRTRDELRVQVHLGALEVQEVWDKAEQGWEHLDSKIKQLRETTQQSAEDVEEATKLLVEEIKSGYKRVRDAL